jgi:hypothetical protein
MKGTSKAVAGLCAATFVYLAAVAPTDRGGATEMTLTIVPVAHADDAELGHSILACFHPTGDFVRATLGAPFQDAPGRTARNGTIDFHGGFTGNAYQMGFVLQQSVIGGDRMWRVTPTSDNAPTQPAANCSLRNWTKG